MSKLHLAAPVLLLTTFASLAGCAADAGDVADDETPAPLPTAGVVLGAPFPSCADTAPNLQGAWPSGAFGTGIYFNPAANYTNACSLPVAQVDQLPGFEFGVTIWEDVDKHNDVNSDHLRWQVFGFKPGHCVGSFCTLAEWKLLGQGDDYGASQWDWQNGDFDSHLPSGAVNVAAGYTSLRVAASAISRQGVVQPVRVSLTRAP